MLIKEKIDVEMKNLKNERRKKTLQKLFDMGWKIYNNEDLREQFDVLEVFVRERNKVLGKDYLKVFKHTKEYTLINEYKRSIDVNLEFALLLVEVLENLT